MNKAVHSSLLTIVIAIAVYAVVAVYSGGEEVLQAINSLSWQLWVGLLSLSLLNYGLRYWRWHLYISHKNPHSLAHWQHLAIYIAGFALTMTPGKAGEGMRSLYLKQHGIPHQRSIGALFVERIMDLLTILMMAGLGLSFLSDGQSQWAGILTLVIIVTAITLVKIPKDKVMASSLIQNLPDKLRHIVFFIESMLNNANDLLSLRFIFLGLFIGIIAWGCEGYGLYLTMQAFDMTPSFDATNTITLAMAIYGMAILIGAISFLPGGLGGTEAAMIFMLVKVGFDHASAVAITFICRIATLWFAMALGVMTMFLLSFLGIKLQQNNVEQD
ncbi:MAG: flippase-like domain-containing protein [Pseudomonadales bacterium]|nr:flippase-like domain-containing protein [Pseudomonadales bacterium]